MSNLPQSLYNNSITPHLDDIRKSYIKLSGRGIIHGILCVDQDAKVIAINQFFDTRLNIWDIASLGAALYGLSRQGIDCFGADDLERSSLVYKNMQFFTRSIGSFLLDERGERKLLLVVLADKQVNFGLIVLQMNKLADAIKDEVSKNTQIKETLKLSETELRDHIKQVKNELFKRAQSLNLTV